ncbi:hypothetical protein CCACVL1_19885 [Corchorus capsularis]|uniref:Uncharacterized protein n=1 Tax=Corchorus capsularis TaxID=210143 RepID=A0A1R3HE63_COCAP|nr:hypothetical protein CCACVL1_19885 [Corchorus capsularis]
MDNRIVDHGHPRGGGKVLNENGNRLALRDIGNLDTLQLIEEKPPLKINRPITRGFRAKLLANAQPAGANKNSVVATVGDGLPVNGKGCNVKKVAKAKKLSEKPDTATIINISSDEQEEKAKKKGGRKTSDEPKPEGAVLISSNDDGNVNPVSEGSSNVRCSRKNVETLTSILTARSKAACGVRTNELKDQNLNIDEGDVNNELAVVEYVDDLYKFYKSTENDARVQDYFCSQQHITIGMRKILVDWLIQAHNSFQLMPETLYLTINILDRYLSRKAVSRDKLQLVGLGSLLIACKYEEIWPPQVADLVSISDYAFVEKQILAMEKAILENLEWYLTVPTPYVFLIRYIKASVSLSSDLENMVFFLAELGIEHFDTVVLYSPSVLAAAAVYAARCTLNRTPFWTATLKHHTGYSEEQLMSCAKLLVAFHQNAAKGKLKGIYSKFVSSSRGSVALLTPAKALLAST